MKFSVQNLIKFSVQNLNFFSLVQKLDCFKVDSSINFGTKQNGSKFANWKWFGNEADSPTAQAI